MIKISIITPVYNAEKFLEKTLISIQNQTFQNFEVLLVDDGSTDQSGQICDEWSRKDNRFKVIHQQNRGVVAARNAGIRAAQGEFIAFLDADDLWLPEKLEKQIAFMKEEGCNLSYTAYRFIDESGNILKEYYPHRTQVNYRQLLRSNCMGCLTVMYRAGEIGKCYVPEVAKGPEDFAMLLSILRKKVEEAFCLNEILAEYRVVSGSRSRNKIQAALGHWYVLRKAEKINTPMIQKLHGKIATHDLLDVHEVLSPIWYLASHKVFGKLIQVRKGL